MKIPIEDQELIALNVQYFESGILYAATIVASREGAQTLVCNDPDGTTTFVRTGVSMAGAPTSGCWTFRPEIGAGKTEAATGAASFHG